MNKEIREILKNTSIKHIMEGKKITRRELLKGMGVVAGGILLAACGVDTAGDPTQNPVPNTEIPPLPNMDNVGPNPDKFSTNKILAGIETMNGIDATELEKFKSRAELAAQKIGLNLSDPLYETVLFGIKLQDDLGGEINHLFVSRSLKANAPLPTVGPASNEADEAGLFFLVDVDYPYFVAPGQGKGDAVMFPVVGYETDKGFALGLGTPNPDGKTYTSTFGFCEININKETNEAEGVTYVDPFSGNHKKYDSDNIPTELQKMYAKVLPMPIAQEEPAPKPEEPEIKMTLEDWKKVFSGPCEGDDGKMYDMEGLLGSNYAEQLRDPDEILNLVPETPILILHSGSIITLVDQSYAIDMLKQGAFVFTFKGTSSTAYFVGYAIAATGNAYKNGNENIHVVLKEVTSKRFDHPDYTRVFLRNIYTTMENGRIITPIMDLPKHLKVAINAKSSKDYLTPEEAGLTLDPVYWLDQITAAGYDRIAIFCQ